MANCLHEKSKANMLHLNGSPGEISRRRFLAGSLGVFVVTTSGTLPLLSAAAGAQESATPPRSGVRRIILDTDPGVDDALAILLALRSPELRVEAITPVAGNVPLELTLSNALKLVELAGRTDIPVAAGASAPLVRRLVTAKSVHGDNGLGGVELPTPTTKPVKESATGIIRRLVRENPGEISIVAVGPLTNVALALRSDPELAGMIRSIVIMGGSLSGGNVTPAAEFNLYVDPEAARIVFDSGVPLTMVGLDVTRKVLLQAEHVKALAAGKSKVSQVAAQIMQKTMDRWSDGGRRAVAMHDPLTVAHLIDPGLLRLQDYYVLVETSGEATAGQTLGYASAPVRKSAALETGAGTQEEAPPSFKPNAKVALDVDAGRFFQLLLGRLAQ